MDLKDLRTMNIKEIKKELKDKQQAIQEMRFKIALDEHSQVRDYRNLRKDIAQIKTIIKEMESQTDAKPSVEEKVEPTEAKTDK